MDRVFALVVAVGVLSSSAAEAALFHCPVGKVYFRSKHKCTAKVTAINLGIYHSHRSVAKAGGVTIVHRHVDAQTGAPAIPLPPVRAVHNGLISAPLRKEKADRIGAITPPAPAADAVSPYGTLAPVTPAGR